MKKHFLLLSLLISTYAISSPDWVSDSKKGCSSSELCAVGTGETRIVAEKNARVALSKIFTNKLSSKLSSSLKSSGGEIAEDVSENIDEATETVLTGTEIKKNHEDKVSFYALAVVNKSKAGDALKSEIEIIDAEILAISNQGDDIEKVKLEKLYNKREMLNRQYDFLTGKSITAPLAYESIFNQKKTATKGVVIHIFLDEARPKIIEPFLAQMITDMGYRTTTGEMRNKNSTHIITGQYLPEKQYINVEGFEKYKFVLKIKAMRSGTNVESGHLVSEVTEAGRDINQASEKAFPQIKDFLKNNIENLHLR